MNRTRVALVSVLGFAAGAVLLDAQSQAPPSQTPLQCLTDVRAYVTKRSQELRPMTSESASKLSAERTSMIKECAAKYDVKTVAERDLSGLADLYSDAGMLVEANAAVARAMASKSLAASDRAQLMLQSIRLTLREPKGDERNARLEKMVDDLDAFTDADAFDQKFNAHSSMNGYYRADDIDAGIIKHSTWLIERGIPLSPDLRKKYGPSILSAYVNMAEAWAGQGMNDRAVALLKRAPVEWPEIPGVAARINPTLERYLLVGTEAAPITAPVWLNGASSATTLDMKGHVTLLEFTAHWCGPCKESYPGINRLREKYGPKGFRVALATRLYGYFEREQNLDAATEISRDRTYFAEHHLDVPIAITERITGAVKNGVVVYSPGPDPNDTAYKVGGIPQIQIIDKQGRIRLIMVGYDDANEPRLAKFIEQLLGEK
ncbi:MAG TPA: TlpA disulfide reductase family protein [Vicinamibacterales bacterium]|nr:TlpA disulfide reductase family protein [Vicinamibacterales bacterium]